MESKAKYVLMVYIVTLLAISSYFYSVEKLDEMKVELAVYKQRVQDVQNTCWLYEQEIMELNSQLENLKGE